MKKDKIDILLCDIFNDKEITLPFFDNINIPDYKECINRMISKYHRGEEFKRLKVKRVKRIIILAALITFAFSSFIFVHPPVAQAIKTVILHTIIESRDNFTNIIQAYTFDDNLSEDILSNSPSYGYFERSNQGNFRIEFFDSLLPGKIMSFDEALKECGVPLMTLGYIPEGYEFNQLTAAYGIDNKIVSITQVYVGLKDNGYIKLVQTLHIRDYVSTEYFGYDYSVKEIDIMGADGLLITSGKSFSLAKWTMYNSMFQMEGALSEEEMIDILKGLKWIEK